MRVLLDCKVCKYCSVEKPLEDFVAHKDCVGGRSNQCKDCARERTREWNRANQARRSQEAKLRARATKAKAVEYMGGECFDCKQKFHQCVYQFHHLDGSTKDENPSHLFNCKWERLVEELSKCVMLCANCHMIRHYGGGE